MGNASGDASRRPSSHLTIFVVPVECGWIPVYVPDGSAKPIHDSNGNFLGYRGDRHQYYGEIPQDQARSRRWQGLKRNWHMFAG